MWFVTIFALLGIGYFFGSKKPVKSDPCELLKNALLAHALDVVGENFDTDKDMYDGRRLPPLVRGIENTYFSYIMDKEEVKEDPLYTEECVQRITAVEKYIETQLKTKEDVYTFFEKFLAKLR